MQSLKTFIQSSNVMHQIFRKFSWASLVVFQGSLATGVEVPIPSGDFESGRGNWEEIFGGGSTIYEYPANGGNPGGYGVMENVGGYGIWVSNFNQPLLLSELGLVAGEVYSFRMDMRILSGSNLGGFKIDFFSQGNAAGSTGDLFPAVIGDGSSWSTYDFEVAVPNGVDGIKVVPLWGPNSRVAYDNIRVETTPVVVPDQIPDADFSAPDGALWEQTSGGGTFVFEFPGSGGNVGGYAVIDHSANDGGFGVLVSNGGTALQLSQLGLTAGETYRFGLDMRLISGSRIGGLKVDFFSGAEAAGSTGDLFPPVIGSGATWETYEFEVTLPPSATAIKVVGLWGAGSIVGYDNFFFDPTPLVVAPISEIPNRDFEAGLQGWSVAGEPDTQFAASADGGNPGGYVTMTNSGTGFGVLVSNGGAPLPLAGLGLEAGRTYQFRQDMRLLSGDRIGGLKVEFYNGPGAAGDTGDLYPQIIGDGSTWETYEFEVTIPPTVNGIKIVPLWGPGSSVGFDNIAFDSRALPGSPVLNPNFEQGGAYWAEFQVGTTYRYPATGGSPGGYLEMSNNGEPGTYGVVVANNSSIIPKSRFGIEEEGVYPFQLDMKIFSGSSIGGLKVEFFDGELSAGDTGDLFPAVIGDGRSWETYTFDVFIPGNVDGLKITPLWGSGSVVGFDNVVTPGALTNGFERWISGFPGVGDLTGYNDDPDGDGQPNGMENFLGTDPSVPSHGLTILDRRLTESGDFLFSHPINLMPVPEASSGRYLWSTDLVHFYEDGEAAPDGTAFAFDTSPGIPTTGLIRVIRVASIGRDASQRVFVQLRVTGATEGK